jgi:type I restriction enzyme M protein
VRFLVEIVRHYRGESTADKWEPRWDEIRMADALKKDLQKAFRKSQHTDILGFCKQSSLKDIAAKGYSLSPGVWVGVAPGEEVSDEDFKEQFEILNEERKELDAQARKIEQTIDRNAAKILGM